MIQGGDNKRMTNLLPEKLPLVFQVKSDLGCKVRKLCLQELNYANLQSDRRRIKSDLFNGNICGIAATNALELGIDAGHIDATLHLGFPGSIASLWEQAGRAGRREKPSLAIYVAFEGPLDQYLMKFPHKLFRGIECCHVDPNNDQVLQQHLSCAALEHPLSLVHDEKYFGPALEGSITRLQNKGCLSTDPSRDCASRMWTYIGLFLFKVMTVPLILWKTI